MANTEGLKEGILNRDKKAIAKSITIIENCSTEAKDLLKSINNYTGNSHIIGITGFGGSGKSTLINQIIHVYRNKGLKVGVLAVDPSSPYSGGAILGDRIRMTDHFTDKDVFIRSMATRGQLGGLAREAYNATKVLEAAGFEKIIVETIGTGQDEVDIVKIADTTIVVLVPGYGDDIQAMKAGMIEIADIFVINKSDKEGADKTRLQIEMALELEQGKKKPLICNTVAYQDKGIEELVKGIEEHLEYLKKENHLEKKRKERIKKEIYNIMAYESIKIAEARIDIAKAIEEIYSNQNDPYSVVEKALENLKSHL